MANFNVRRVTAFGIVWDMNRPHNGRIYRQTVVYRAEDNRKESAKRIWNSRRWFKDQIKLGYI